MATTTKTKPKKSTRPAEILDSDLEQEREPEEPETEDDTALLPTTDVASDEAQPPITPAVATKPEPFTPGELAAYDADTVVLVREAEAVTANAESVFADSKEQASSDKKFFEAKVEDLRKLIRGRTGEEMSKGMIHVVKVNGLRLPVQRAKICYVGRAFAGWPASKWGNPYRISVGGNALERFVEYAWWQPEAWLADLWEACEHGAKPLGCWCVNAVHGDGQAVVCHAQILAAMLHEIANREESK